MKDRFNDFMSGRYGVDDLSKFMLGSSVALMVLNMFARLRFLNTLIIVLLILIYLRMFSTNIRKRWEENQKYLQQRDRVKALFGGKISGDSLRQDARAFFEKQKHRAEDLKENHIYKCPSCGQKIRIPRGKGKICVTCPKCKTEFTRKS